VGIGAWNQSVGHGSNLVLEGIDRLREQLSKVFASLRANNITRIGPGRQAQNPQIDFVRHEEC
jgi:hypothetical protein